MERRRLSAASATCGDGQISAVWRFGHFLSSRARAERPATSLHMPTVHTNAQEPPEQALERCSNKSLFSTAEQAVLAAANKRPKRSCDALWCDPETRSIMPQASLGLAPLLRALLMELSFENRCSRTPRNESI